MNELGSEHIDNDEYGQIVFKMKLVEEMETNIHLMRNTWYLDGAPGFEMVGAAARRLRTGDLLLSLPMYAKYARLRIKQIPMERLLLKLKEPENREHIKFLKDAISTTLDRVGMKDKYAVWSHHDMQDTTREAEFTLETIFNVVIVITMFICFFSLSSSMTGNLYEQCKDIAVMRSIGFTKSIITKLYIYEAFILVAAASISGVGIGTIAGYSISF
jgi:ABC-type antimicrobial peptide transport system permease subunit